MPSSLVAVAKPVIELKRFTSNERLSQDSTAYGADVWVDGVFSFTASNHGTGGGDEYDAPYDHKKEVYDRSAYDFAMAKLQAYAETQPPTVHTFGGGRSVSLPVTVESLVHEEITKLQNAKFAKRDIGKITREMQSHVFALDKAGAIVKFRFKGSPIGQKQWDHIAKINPDLQVLNARGSKAIYELALAHSKTK